MAGVASRRAAEEMIRAGRVAVNGETIRVMGQTVDPAADRVLVDGREARPAETKVYYLFNKPKNVVVTRDDPEGRPTILDYLKGIPCRVNPVGRLDFDSEGLLLLTNDGDLHFRMTHPKKEVPKTYHVRVVGSPSAEDLQKLAGGIDIGGYTTRPCRVAMRKQEGKFCWLEVVLTEGKNRQIRRMVERLDLKVIRLIRVAIGPLQLGRLRPGEFRPLTAREIEEVRRPV